MFQTKVVESMKYDFIFIFSLKNRASCEIMWKNVVQSDRPQTKTKHGAAKILIVYRITKARIQRRSNNIQYLLLHN